jgi:hypothetical protein
MKQRTLRLGLSLMVVVSVWTTRLPAQDVFVVPAVPYEPAQHPDFPAAIYPRPLPPPAKYLPTRVLNHFNLGCQADPWGTTGNVFSEARWIFGSSRSFFGEKCVPCQPCADRQMQRANGMAP